MGALVVTLWYGYLGRGGPSVNPCFPSVTTLAAIVPTSTPVSPRLPPWRRSCQRQPLFPFGDHLGGGRANANPCFPSVTTLIAGGHPTPASKVPQSNHLSTPEYTYEVEYAIWLTMTCPRTSNQDRAKWRTECRKKLADHIRKCAYRTATFA